MQTALTLANDQQDLTTDNPSAQDHRCTQTVLLPLLIVVASTMRYFFVFSTLGLKWSNQLSLQLDQYNETKFKNETFISEATSTPMFKASLMGGALLLAVASKIANYHYAKKNNGEHWAFEQRYVIPFLSSSTIYFAIDFVRGMGATLDLKLFIASNFIFIPMIFAFYKKLAMPTDNNRLIVSQKDLKATPFYDPKHPSYVSPTYFERSMNATASIVLMATTIVTVCSAVNKQTTDVVFPMGSHQWVTIPVAAIPAGIGGALLTEHPRHYHAYLSLMRALRGGAYTYFTMSSLLKILFHDFTESKPADVDEKTRITIAITGFSAALLIATYSGFSTLFRAEENHEANVLLESKLKSMAKKTRRFFQKIEDCCCCKSSSDLEGVMVINNGSDLNTPILR